MTVVVVPATTVAPSPVDQSKDWLIPFFASFLSCLPLPPSFPLSFPSFPLSLPSFPPKRPSPRPVPIKFIFRMGGGGQLQEGQTQVLKQEFVTCGLRKKSQSRRDSFLCTMPMSPCLSRSSLGALDVYSRGFLTQSRPLKHTEATSRCKLNSIWG